MKIFGIVSAIVIVGLIAILGGSYLNAVNLGNRLENRIEAQLEENRNVLAQYGNRMAETAQVPDVAKADIIEVTNAALQGRYGEDGANSVFLSIQEQNPSVDPALYRQIQQVMEAGRIEFQNSQTALIDQKRVYNDALESAWTGLWLSVAGFPRDIDPDTIQIISTDRANTVFQTGVEEPIQLGD